MHPNLELTSHDTRGSTLVRIFDDRVEWADEPSAETSGRVAPATDDVAAVAGGTGDQGGGHCHVVALPTVTGVAIRRGKGTIRTVELTSAGDTIGFRVPMAAAALVAEAIRDGILDTAA